MSKLSSTSLLCLYALDIDPAEVTGPLAQFQLVRADKDGTFRLLEALNSASQPRLNEDSLRRVFELWWPQLESVLSAIPASAAQRGAIATLDDKIEKVLTLLERLVEKSEAEPRSQPAPTGTAVPGRDTSRRPRGFIGSSSEGLPIAQAIQELLDPVAECTIWNQGVFEPSATFIESLQNARLVYDFAVVVLTPDDAVTSRGSTMPAPRDNLLLELGLFAGALGRARTFLVLPTENPPKLPSDLSGVTITVYRSRSDGNLVAALGPAISQITRAMGIARNAV